MPYVEFFPQNAGNRAFTITNTYNFPLALRRLYFSYTASAVPASRIPFIQLLRAGVSIHDQSAAGVISASETRQINFSVHQDSYESSIIIQTAINPFLFLLPSDRFGLDILSDDAGDTMQFEYVLFEVLSPRLLDVPYNILDAPLRA